MLCAGTCWGLMAPIGKDAMLNGIDGIDLVSFRVLGGALLFWLTSLFTKKEHVPVKDILLLGCAGLFALVFNQCSYTIGLNLTSPSNSSIMTTSMPIFAMVLSFFILKEPITWQKAGGVLLGCAGAVIIITTSATAGNAKVGNIWGDLLCMSAQLSFALYLSLFKPLVQKYSLFTVNKWMFTLGHTDNMALHPWPCLKHRFCFRAHEHMVGNGLCGVLRHLHQLHLHDGWPADPSSDGCQRLQLHAATSVGKRQRGCWPCCVQDLTSLGRHSRVLGRLVRGKIEIET